MSRLSLAQDFQSALRAIAGTPPPGPVGVAVSGGSDSLALLELAHDWSQRNAIPLLALTVDHGLRPEAADEAAMVARHCSRAGIEHITLSLSGAGRRQSALRLRRHQVLALALRARSGKFLLTGHTLDDQAETFLMRARQGSGWYGLAGMRSLALSPAWPEGEGVFICRPLLRQRRAALQAFLMQRSLCWASDPSNADPAYERVRMRSLLESRPALFHAVRRLCADFGRLRREEDRQMALALRNGVCIDAGSLRFDLACAPAEERLVRILGLLLQIVSGRPAAPRSDALIRLARRLADPADFVRSTLGGCLIAARGGHVSIAPESPGGDPDSQASMIWRLAAHMALMSGEMEEIDAFAGRGSSFDDLMPIFQRNPPS